MIDGLPNLEDLPIYPVAMSHFEMGMLLSLVEQAGEQNILIGELLEPVRARILESIASNPAESEPQS